MEKVNWSLAVALLQHHICQSTKLKNQKSKHEQIVRRNNFRPHCEAQCFVVGSQPAMFLTNASQRRTQVPSNGTMSSSLRREIFQLSASFDNNAVSLTGIDFKYPFPLFPSDHLSLRNGWRDSSGAILPCRYQAEEQRAVIDDLQIATRGPRFSVSKVPNKSS